MNAILVRRAKPRDVSAIAGLMDEYVQRRILLGKEWVALYEDIQEFVVAERDGEIVGCGALHVMWEHLAEIRTLAVRPEVLGTGAGHALVTALLDRARDLEIPLVVCLTFEVDFFARHGFTEVENDLLDPGIVAELVRSFDDGIAEFLDLPRVRPNTLGNTRMMLRLDTAESHS